MNNMHGVISWFDLFGLLFYSPFPPIPFLLPSLPHPEMVNVLQSGAAPPNREWVNPLCGRTCICNRQQQQHHYSGPCCPWQPINWLLGGPEPQPFPYGKAGRNAPLCWAPPPCCCCCLHNNVRISYLFSLLFCTSLLHWSLLLWRSPLLCISKEQIWLLACGFCVFLTLLNYMQRHDHSSCPYLLRANYSEFRTGKQYSKEYLFLFFNSFDILNQF